MDNMFNEEIHRCPVTDISNAGDTGSTQQSPSPVTSSDQEYTEKKETDDRTQKERENTDIPYWDICKIVELERNIPDVDEDRGLQVIKVVTYIILFCILLWCSVAQKHSLMVLVAPPLDQTANNTEYEEEKYRNIAAAKHILLTIAIIIPYCLTLLNSILKWMFNNLEFPSLSTFTLCLFVEVLHSIGICILAYIVLPEIDIVRGILLLNGVAVVPAVLFPICASDVTYCGRKNNHSALVKVTVSTLNISTCLIQISYIPFVLRLDYFVEDSKMDHETDNIAYFIISMILVSCAYWKNFVDDRFCGKTRSGGCWGNFILKAKLELQQCRPIISTFTSFIKIGATVLLSWLIKEFYEKNTDSRNKHNSIADVTFSEAYYELRKLPLAYSGAIITLILSAFVGHYVGYTACKLRLQRFSYNIPLIISTPLAIAIAVVDCSWISLLEPFTKEKALCRTKEDLAFLHYPFGFAVWMSLYWLCRHIFYPNIERLAKIER